MSDNRDNLQIFLAGDSTMAQKEDREYPEHGWGMTIGEFFLPGVTFHNEAVNGRSTKSFINESRWQSILERIGPGDYVFIQFGHNDEKREDPSRYADPFGAYSRNLEYFIDSVRVKKANPVLLTSVCRRKFDDRGVLEMTHGEYPRAMKAVAARTEGALHRYGVPHRRPAHRTGSGAFDCSFHAPGSGGLSESSGRKEG